MAGLLSDPAEGVASGGAAVPPTAAWNDYAAGPVRPPATLPGLRRAVCRH